MDDEFELFGMMKGQEGFGAIHLGTYRTELDAISTQTWLEVGGRFVGFEIKKLVSLDLGQSSQAAQRD